MRTLPACIEESRCLNADSVIHPRMGTAPPARPRSTNTSKTKRSASSAALIAMGIVQPAPSESTATVTVAISVCGVDRPQQGIARRVQVKLTRNNRLNLIGPDDEKNVDVSICSFGF